MADQNNSGKKSGGVFKLAAAFIAVAGMGVVSYISFVPHSDRKSAESFLKQSGYSVVEYEGAPTFKGKEKGDYYADEFKVVAPNSKDTVDVVVTSGPVNGSKIKFFP